MSLGKEWFIFYIGHKQVFVTRKKTRVDFVCPQFFLSSLTLSWFIRWQILSQHLHSGLDNVTYFSSGISEEMTACQFYAEALRNITLVHSTPIALLLPLQNERHLEYPELNLQCEDEPPQVNYRPVRNICGHKSLRFENVLLCNNKKYPY